MLASIQAAEEGRDPGLDPAAATASAAGPHGTSVKFWTAKLEAEGAERGPQLPAAASEAAGGSSSAAAAAATAAEAQPPAEAGAAGAGGGAAAGPRLLLLPVATRELAPLSLLAQRLVGAALQGLLRALGSGVDGEALSEQLLQLLGVVYEPVGASGPWIMAWVWRLYKVGGQARSVAARQLAGGPEGLRLLALRPWTPPRRAGGISA